MVETTMISQALRRRFLLDMAYPEASSILCDFFGLVSSSEEVATEEMADSAARMERLASNPDGQPIVPTAAYMAEILSVVEEKDWELWLLTYALAVVNLLEDLGLVSVHDE